MDVSDTDEVTMSTSVYSGALLLLYGAVDEYGNSAVDAFLDAKLVERVCGCLLYTSPSPRD